MGKYLIKFSGTGTWISCLVMRVILIDLPKVETAASKTQVIFLRNTQEQINKKVGSIVSC